MYKTAIRKAWSQLVEDMEPKELLDSFTEHLFFSTRKIRDLREIQNTGDKNRKILDSVLQAGPEKYELFKRCLVESHQSHLRDLLLAKEREVENSTDEVPVVAMAGMNLQPASPAMPGNQPQQQCHGSQHSTSPTPERGFSETDGPPSKAQSYVDSGSVQGMHGPPSTSSQAQSAGTHPVPVRTSGVGNNLVHETAVKQVVGPEPDTVDAVVGLEPNTVDAAYEDIFSTRSMKNLGKTLNTTELFRLAMKLGVQSHDYNKIKGECNEDLVRLNCTVLLHWLDNGEKNGEKTEIMFNKLVNTLEEMGRNDIRLSIIECKKQGKCFQLLY